MAKIITFYVVLLLSVTSFAKDKIHCFHPQSCFLLNTIIKDNNLVVPLNFFHGDPHHYSPSMKQIKELNSVNNLIIPPKSLHPWISDIIKSRKNKSTLELLPIQSDLKLSKESKSHFWLEFESLKNNLNLIKEFLLKNNIKIKDNYHIFDKYIKKEDLLKSKFKDTLFVITHDSIEPFFKKLNLSYKTLKGSHHHEDIKSSTIKKLIKSISKDVQTIWIIEKDIHIPKMIHQMIPEGSTLINWDSLGNTNQSSLIDLVEKLEKN